MIDTGIQPQSIPDQNSLSTDLAIIGGGLAGLCLSIQMATAGFRVCLMEKEVYPFHKVCGEYISMESWPFLKQMGLPLEEMNLPRFSTLEISAPGGKKIRHRLDTGGFGISRNLLDHKLSIIAKSAGVLLLENTKVTDVEFDGNRFNITAGNKLIYTSVCAGSFGKRSNLDIKWNREFVSKKPDRLNNYIGVKYHVRYPVEKGLIALHNFDNGYCGISAIEDEHCCLCYLTTSANLQKHHNSIGEMEKITLSRNPYLKKIFSEAEFLYKKPEVISQISFDKKSLIQNHILMVGDAAGMITPLCGNGMSMAMHGSKIAAELMQKFLSGKIGREEMEAGYEINWNRNFSSRLSTGRRVQALFGHPIVTNLFVSAMKPFPLLMDMLIRKTHGQPF